MLFEEMLKDERAEGREEGRIAEAQEMIFELLSLYGEVPADLTERIRSVKDIAALRQLLKKASQAKSLSEFESVTDL